MHGNIKDQYARIQDYCVEIKRPNIGSFVFVTRAVGDGNLVFEKMYQSFAALEKGFDEGYRPIISLDSCHMKGPHPRLLLASIIIDANKLLYPIAQAMFEVRIICYLDLFLREVNWGT